MARKQKANRIADSANGFGTIVARVFISGNSLTFNRGNQMDKHAEQHQEKTTGGDMLADLLSGPLSKAAAPAAAIAIDQAGDFAALLSQPFQPTIQSPAPARGGLFGPPSPIVMAGGHTQTDMFSTPHTPGPIAWATLEPSGLRIVLCGVCRQRTCKRTRWVDDKGNTVRGGR